MCAPGAHGPRHFSAAHVAGKMIPADSFALRAKEPWETVGFPLAPFPGLAAAGVAAVFCLPFVLACGPDIPWETADFSLAPFPGLAVVGVAAVFGLPFVLACGPDIPWETVGFPLPPFPGAAVAGVAAFFCLLPLSAPFPFASALRWTREASFQCVLSMKWRNNYE